MKNLGDRDEVHAGEYVLGTLDHEERVRFSEQLKHDPALQARVEAWHRRLESLESGTDSSAPPPELWDRIDGALDDDDTPTGTPEVGALTIRADEEGWFLRSPGVEKKTLYVDRDAGFESYLLRLAAGACIPAHEHRATEECLMIEGELDIGELRLRAGDYHVMTADTGHPEIHSAHGALAYLRTEIKSHAG